MERLQTAIINLFDFLYLLVGRTDNDCVYYSHIFTINTKIKMVAFTKFFLEILNYKFNR